MIRGVTHDKDGRVVQRLQVVTKVAIGLGPDEKAGRKAPIKLDHFVFLRKVLDGKDIRWVPDEALTEKMVKLYTEKPTSIPIILLDDDMENVFATSYSWYARSGLKCRGDGLVAFRKTEEHPRGQEWTPCGDECPDLQEGRCKPSGYLHFILEDNPMLGSVCRLHTTSFRSVRKIHSSLDQMQTMFRGRLSGLRCRLAVRPEPINYQDKEGKSHKTTVYVLNIEIPPGAIQSFQKLVSSATEHARYLEQTNKLLGTGRTVEYRVVEDEEELAKEIQPEFYPAESEQAEPELAMPKRLSETKRKPKEAGNGDGPIDASRISSTQVSELWALGYAATPPKSKAEIIEIVKRHGFDSVLKITRDKYEAICAEAQAQDEVA